MAAAGTRQEAMGGVGGDGDDGEERNGQSPYSHLIWRFKNSSVNKTFFYFKKILGFRWRPRRLPFTALHRRVCVCVQPSFEL